jgi:hypothetical protein
MKIFGVVATLLLCACMASAGSSPAVSFTSVNTNFTNGTWSLGWQFTTNAAVDVTALGFYDAGLTGGSQGLAGCVGCGQVGIYNSTGTLLVTGLVTTLGTLVGDFYYVNVPLTLLAPGQTYFVVAETGNAQYTWNPNGFSANPDINFVKDAYVFSPVLAFPTSSSGVTGWFGANFLFNPVATPEPSSLMMMGSGLALMGPWLRRRLTRS